MSESTKYGGRKSSSNRAAKIMSDYTFMGVITITAGNTIEIDPPSTPMSTFRGGPLVWLVHNLHTSPHKVRIGADKTVRRSDQQAFHPFEKDTDEFKSGNVKSQEWGSVVASTFSEKANEKYKYTIEATGSTPALDPDLDVTDPPTILTG